MMITTCRILWIPTPGGGVGTEVVVFPVPDGLDPLVVEPARRAWEELPPHPARSTAANNQPASSRPRRRPFKS
jgi:hypothetical protein